MQGKLKTLNFAVGHFVFAKCQNHNPWPAKIISITLAPVKNTKQEEYVYQVSYFGANSFAYHCQNELEPFNKKTYHKYEQFFQKKKGQEEKKILKIMKSTLDKYEEGMANGLFKPASIYQPILLNQQSTNKNQSKNSKRQKSQMTKTHEKHQQSFLSVKESKKNTLMTKSVANSEVKVKERTHPKVQQRNSTKQASPKGKIKRQKNKDKHKVKKEKQQNYQDKLQVGKLIGIDDKQTKRSRLQKKKKEKEKQSSFQNVPSYRALNQEKRVLPLQTPSQSAYITSYQTSDDLSIPQKQQQNEMLKLIRNEESSSSSQASEIEPAYKGQKKSVEYVKIERKEQNNIDSSTDELKIGFNDYTKLTRTIYARVCLIQNTSQAVLCSLANKYLERMTDQLSHSKVQEVKFKILSMKKKQTLMAIFQGQLVGLEQLIKNNTLHTLYKFTRTFEKSKSYIKDFYEMEYHCMRPTLKHFLDQLSQNIDSYGLTSEKKAEFQNLIMKFFKQSIYGHPSKSKMSSHRSQNSLVS